MAILLDTLLLSPVKGVVWLASKIKEQAEREMLDEESVRRELREIYQQLEREIITEEAFEAREEQLLERLEAIEAYKEQHR
jgi:hypothetical protein